MNPPLFRVLLLLFALALTGCNSMRRPGFPRQSYSASEQIKLLEDAFEKPGLIRQYYASTNASEAERKAIRNTIITGRIALINLNYNRFVSEFSFTKQAMDTTSELGELGLNLATTAVGGASAKAVLGAVSSGVTGVKLAIDKNFFFEKTVPVLITSMNAQRKEALLPIMKGIGKSTEEYPLAQALSDVDAYYFAGTFIGALQAIQADAGNKDAKATQRLNAVRVTAFVEDDAGNLLQTFWMPGLSDGDLTVNAEHQQKIQQWLDEHDLKSVPIQTLISGDLFVEIRKQAIKDLGLKPTK